MVRKRRRKKLPVPERQPLVRPIQPNEVWSTDFARLPLRLCRLGLCTLAHQRGHAFGHALSQESAELMSGRRPRSFLNCKAVLPVRGLRLQECSTSWRQCWPAPVAAISHSSYSAAQHRRHRRIDTARPMMGRGRASTTTIRGPRRSRACNKFGRLTLERWTATSPLVKPWNSACRR